MSKNDKGRKLVSLCVLGMVFFVLFSLVPSFTPVVPTDAAFSSITITDVTPTEFSPGDTSEVIVTVKNNGGRDAKDIRLAFQGTEVLSPVGRTVAHLNTLNSWSSKEVKITIHVEEEAANGIYPIPVTCSWREYYFDPAEGYVTGPEQTVDLGLSFVVRGSVVINVGTVTTDPTDIRPGNENVELRAVIENSGEAAAKDVEARLICNADFKPSWSGTDRSYLGRLNSGGKGEAIFHIDVADGIESKMYSIPLQIRYKDTKGGEYEVMRSVEILVKPKPDFAIISHYTEPANISAGDYVTLYVRIRNVGSEKAESVSVRSIGEAEVPFDFDVKSDYVGNLKPNEEWTAVLKFDVDTDALPKAYQQGIEIRCTGDRDLGDDNVYLFDKMIPIGVSSNSPGGTSIPGFGFLSSLIALFVFFVLFLKRKR
jgi:hypothetical protein